MRAVIASEAAHSLPAATMLLPKKSLEVFDSPKQTPSGGSWKISSPGSSARVSSPKQSTQPPLLTPPRPALGPVITPTRQSQTPGSNASPRRISYVSDNVLISCVYLTLTSSRQPSKAWSAPTPIAPALVASTRGMSFVAIQQLELDHGGSSSASSKDKRSLLQIQEEEESKRHEEEFLKWWQAEEDRVRLESQAQSALSSSSKPNSKRRGRKQKKKAPPAAP